MNREAKRKAAQVKFLRRKKNRVWECLSFICKMDLVIKMRNMCGRKTVRIGSFGVKSLI